MTRRINAVGRHRDAFSKAHVFDALVAANTGWLAPDGLQLPPPDFNIASGWIWLPKPTPST
jgi:hypothetical protein